MILKVSIFLILFMIHAILFVYFHVNFISKHKSKSILILNQYFSNNQSSKIEAISTDWKLNADKCINVTILNIIPVRPEDFKSRSFIRSHRGRSDVVNVTGLRPVFFTGLTNDTMIQDELIKEAKLYNDLVQIRISDTYHNLTLKMIHALNWANMHCRDVKWILKTDTDVFVNILAVSKELPLFKDDFICQVRWKNKVCYEE